jgi:NADH:ubiquinone oxidoreductase subunit C
MDAETIISSLTGAFPDALSDAKVESSIRVGANVNKDRVKEVCQYLKDTLEFDHLSAETAVDYINDNEIEIVYLIASYNHPVLITLKARLPRDNPEIQSIVPVYWNANWYEREVYELFGVNYIDHPDLRPLVLFPGMLGDMPLRKDYEGFPNKTAKNLV